MASWTGELGGTPRGSLLSVLKVVESEGVADDFISMKTLFRGCRNTTSLGDARKGALVHKLVMPMCCGG